MHNDRLREFSTTAFVVSFLVCLLAIFPLKTLAVVLNALYVGVMLATGIAYGRLLWASWFNVDPPDRAQRMAQGFGYLWLGMHCVLGSSLYLYARDMNPPTSIVGVAGRYFAIVASVYMVTAPDYGLGWFYGRDRKLLWAALVAGALIAVAALYVQTVPVLAEQF